MRNDTDKVAWPTAEEQTDWAACLGLAAEASLSAPLGIVRRTRSARRAAAEGDGAFAQPGMIKCCWYRLVTTKARLRPLPVISGRAISPVCMRTISKALDKPRCGSYGNLPVIESVRRAISRKLTSDNETTRCSKAKDPFMHAWEFSRDIIDAGQH
jgi:hypothetical protein